MIEGFWTGVDAPASLERLAAIGYSVTIVGSVFDPPRELTDPTPAVGA
ncbi:hypothetical protein ACWD3I_25840 [Streptomyces sp. NPDC002817]